MQVHGEVDTGVGAPSYFSALLHFFYPDFSASLGLGFQYNNHDKLGYCVRGKKAFSLANDGLLSFNIKGRYNVDKELVKKKSRGAAEFSWSIFNFQRDQDVRLKVGYELFEKVPYLQIRENNWTLNADIYGRWNLRFDL